AHEQRAPRRRLRVPRAAGGGGAHGGGLRGRAQVDGQVDRSARDDRRLPRRDAHRRAGAARALRARRVSRGADAKEDAHREVRQHPGGRQGGARARDRAAQAAGAARDAAAQVLRRGEGGRERAALRADSWWRRIYEGLRRGEAVARCDGHADLRGYVADPGAHGDEGHARRDPQEPAAVRAARGAGALACAVVARRARARGGAHPVAVVLGAAAPHLAHGGRQAEGDDAEADRRVAAAVPEELESQARLRLCHAARRAAHQAARRRSGGGAAPRAGEEGSGASRAGRALGRAGRAALPSPARRDHLDRRSLAGDAAAGYGSGGGEDRMSVSLKFIRYQGPVLRGMGEAAMGALKQRLGGKKNGNGAANGHGAATETTPALPGREHHITVSPRPAELVNAYVRWVGGDPSSYKGRVPAHLFPQWGFPLTGKLVEGLKYPMLAAMNGGCKLTINAQLPAGE